MQNLEKKQSILVIAGMHRSGTSYVASLLQDAGFDMGENLLGATVSNLKGHFEDVDFLRFHERALYSQGLSPEGWVIQNKIQVQEQLLEDAQTIIQARNSKSFWGWKDPRTTLFLDFWFDLLPEAKYLFVYRSPSEVLDSLYRRGDEIFFKNPMFALQIWLNYNQAILDFYKKHPNKCIILSVYDTIAHPENLIELLNSQFNLKLHLSQNLFDDSLFHRQTLDLHRPSLLKQYFPETIDLYQQLHETAKLFGDSTDISLLNDLQTDSNYKTWLFQDWQDACRFKREQKVTEQQLHHTQLELEQSHQQLHHTQLELEQSHQQLHHTQLELEQSHQQLHHTQLELEQSHQQLHHTQLELEQSHQQLHHTQLELEQSQKEIETIHIEWQESQIKLEDSHQQWEDLQLKFKDLSNICGNFKNLQTIQNIKLEEQEENLKFLKNDLQNSFQQEKTLKELIIAMESSKFWKLRKQWFLIKKLIGLKVETQSNAID